MSRCSSATSALSLVDVLRQLAIALHHVHSCGIIHRDLKPANVFLHQGGVRLGDFGLSTELEHASEDAAVRVQRGPQVHTRGLGTPTYASPEQLNGDAYDQKTDIYSLGMVIFEMFNPTCTVMERHSLFARARNRDFPEAMVARYPKVVLLLHRVLSPHPADRPSAPEIVESEMMLSSTTADQVLGEQTSLIRSMKKTLLWQAAQMSATVQGTGTPPATIAAPEGTFALLKRAGSPQSEDIDNKGSAGADVLAEMRGLIEDCDREDSPSEAAPHVISEEAEAPEREEMTMALYIGPWSRHAHPTCFWGFRVKVVSIIISFHSQQQCVPEMLLISNQKLQHGTGKRWWDLVFETTWESMLWWLQGPSHPQ